MLDHESVGLTLLISAEKHYILGKFLDSFFTLQSPMFDGKVPHWHHFSCFWQRAAAQSTSDIDGFSGLRWEDQEKVKKAIESGGATGGQWSPFKRHVSFSSFLTEFARCAFLLGAATFLQEERTQRAEQKKRRH